MKKKQSTLIQYLFNMKLESTNIFVEEHENNRIKIIIKLSNCDFISFVIDRYRTEELRDLLNEFFNKIY